MPQKSLTFGSISSLYKVWFFLTLFSLFQTTYLCVWTLFLTQTRKVWSVRYCFLLVFYTYLYWNIAFLSLFHTVLTVSSTIPVPEHFSSLRMVPLDFKPVISTCRIICGWLAYPWVDYRIELWYLQGAFFLFNYTKSLLSPGKIIESQV